MQKYPALPGDSVCDVAIVGAGITGLSAALMLTEAGLKTITIEMNTIGSAATGSSTGHLDNHYDRKLVNLIKNIGLPAAAQLISAKQKAIDTIQQNVEKYSIDCDFYRIPAYLYTEDENHVNTVEDELISALKLDLKCLNTEHSPLPFPVKKAIRFCRQARISPLAYVAHLAKNITTLGSQIYENTRMIRFHAEKDSVTLTTTKGLIHADSLILAGHTALSGKMSIQPKITPYLSFVTALKVQDHLQDALYWDTSQPYFYTRLALRYPQVLLIGGADKPLGSGQNEQAYRTLRQYAEEHYKVESLLNFWANEYFVSADSLPYVGRLTGYQNVFIAAAFSGDGLTLGTMSAKLIHDQIYSIENPLTEILTPKRVKLLTTMPNVVDSASNVVKHYIKDRMGHKAEFQFLKENEGTVIRDHGKVKAVFKDTDGTVYSFSAKCRHMGCIVHWNSTEKTWDCPCHGGRYDCYGNVISGPPREPLKTLKQKTTIS